MNEEQEQGTRSVMWCSYRSSFLVHSSSLSSRFFSAFEEALYGFERVPLVVGGEVGL